MRYKLSQYAKLHNVTTRTVWNWMYKNIVKHEKDNTGHHWIIETEEDKNKELQVAVYARVKNS